MTHPNPPIGWKPVLAALKSARAFWIAAAALIVLEAALIPVLPRVIPATVYLRAYLPWQAVEQTRRFLAGELDVIPDPVLGWRNRPGHAYRNIRYDRFGSRSSDASFDPETRKAHRVVFVGDSRTHGYTFVSNADTISASMENEAVETLNLATAFYGLDQMVLALEEAVERFAPDAAVIGLGSDTHLLLRSHYVPFLAPEEYGMPFLKPRFETTGEGGLRTVAPDPARLLANVPDNPDLLAFLARKDPLFGRFRTFQRRICFPMIGATVHVKWACGRAARRMMEWTGREDAEEPVAFEAEYRALIERARRIGDARNVSVGFVLYPTLPEFLDGNSGHYDRIAAILQSERVPFVDGRALLKRYRGSERLYADDLHFTAAANRTMAGALSRKILRDNRDEPVIAR